MGHFEFGIYEMHTIGVELGINDEPTYNLIAAFEDESKAKQWLKDEKKRSHRQYVIKRIFTREEYERMEVVNDCRRIRRVLSEIGVTITVEQVEELWRYYSECLYATWIGLPEKNSELLKEILRIIKEQEPEAYADERPIFFEALLDKINKKFLK